MSKARHIVLVGLGWHARRIYYPLLEEACATGQIQLAAVVDTAENRSVIDAFLAGRPWQPALRLEASGQDQLDEAIAQRLLSLRAAGKLDALIVATDPLAHKAYALWALNHDIDLLLDKPISAPRGAHSPGELAEALAADFAEIRAAAQKSQGRFVVMSQRRAHTAYRWIREQLERYRSEFQLAVTALELYHADGMWVLPGEWDRDHHPYKHGAGKLLHSGYHFLDLASWLLAGHEPAGPSQLDFYVQRTSPADALAQQERLLPQLFGAGATKMGDALENYGALDIGLLGQIRSQGRSHCSLSLQLLQNSLSRRASAAPAEDPYKGAGRIRHERLNLQMGPLLNIQAHSYQSHEIREESDLTGGPGHLQHFEVLMFRNSGVLGGPPFERIDFGAQGKTEGHNEAARRRLLSDFLAGAESASPFTDHERTNALLFEIYRALGAAAQAHSALGSLPWKRA